MHLTRVAVIRKKLRWMSDRVNSVDGKNGKKTEKIAFHVN